MYSVLNVFAVKFYGGSCLHSSAYMCSNICPPEAEFWLSLGKVFLAVGLLLFTIVTMLGGNPLRDRFGFRNWNRKSITLPSISSSNEL